MKEFDEIWARPLSEGTVPLLTAACMAGLYNFGKGTLDHLSTYIGLDKKAGQSIFDQCFDIVKKVVKCSDDQALEYLKPRLVAATSTTVTAYEELTQMQELSDQLDKETSNDLKEELAGAKKSSEVAADFAVGWSRKRAATRPPAAPVKVEPAAKKGRKAKAAATPPPPPKRVVPCELEVLQRDVKNMVPPGGFIWRANTKNQWCCRFPPFPQKSFPVKVFGERDCILKCLESLWKVYNLSEGLPAGTCPFEGIFCANGEPVGALPVFVGPDAAAAASGSTAAP
jgi:hypothetical protein